MGRKTTIKEFYFYKKKDSDNYSIDIITGRNEHVPKVITNLNRCDIKELLTNISKDNHNKFMESKKGMKVFNKFPEDKILNYNSTNIVNVYLENLQDIKESSESRHLAANLLRAAADLLAHNDEEEPVEPCEEPVEVDFPTSVEPSPAVELAVPFETINYIQDSLDVTLDFNNLTFWFNDQKWQLQKDIDSHVSPIPKRPKSSPVIMNSMDYMQNLLGVNGEKSVDPNDLSFRFDLEGEIYRISHIYTGDRITKTPKY